MLGRKQILQLFPKDDSYFLFIINLLTNRMLINKCGKSSQKENPKKKKKKVQYYKGVNIVLDAILVWLLE